MISRLAAIAVVLAIGGCAAIGAPKRAPEHPAYGPPLTLRVCLLKPETLSTPRVNTLMAEVREEFSDYGIKVEVPWIRNWSQPGVRPGAIFRAVVRQDLEPPCDRIVALIDRSGSAYVWGLFVPQVLGEADAATSTHAYVAAAYGTHNPLFVNTHEAAVREFYVLLGCMHSMSTADCEHRIAALKGAADPDADFFPGIASDGNIQTTRGAAKEALRSSPP